MSAAPRAKPVPMAATPEETRPRPPATTAKAANGQRRASAARFGLPSDGRAVAMRASARAGRIASAARAGRPRTIPATSETAHQPAATYSVSVSLELVAETTVMAARAVAAPAASRTVIRRRAQYAIAGDPIRPAPRARGRSPPVREP